MEKSSKNRLIPRHASLFKTESLFDRIARAVCRAGTLPRKELYESWETARRVLRKYRGGRVVDLACGSLTDLVIDKAVEAGARVAVLPCCHNLKTNSTGNLSNWMDGSLAIDTVRALGLASKGYAITTQKIPDTITPKNRLLMGHPIASSAPQTSL